MKSTACPASKEQPPKQTHCHSCRRDRSTDPLHQAHTSLWSMSRWEQKWGAELHTCTHVMYTHTYTYIHCTHTHTHTHTKPKNKTHQPQAVRLCGVGNVPYDGAGNTHDFAAARGPQQKGSKLDHRVVELALDNGPCRTKNNWFQWQSEMIQGQVCMYFLFKIFLAILNNFTAALDKPEPVGFCCRSC